MKESVNEEIETQNNYKPSSREEIFLERLNETTFEYVKDGRKYEKSDVTIDIQCKICGHQTEIKPSYLTRKKCSVCKKKKQYHKNEREMWERTWAIVEDKNGRIIGIDSDAELGDTNSYLIILCSSDHNFALTHVSLYRDRWCPYCDKTGIGKPRSLRTYNMGQPEMSKSEKIKYVAKLKGCSMITKSFRGYKMPHDIICDLCGKEMRLTGEQIFRKKFLCPTRCQAGPITKMSDIGSML